MFFAKIVLAAISLLIYNNMVQCFGKSTYKCAKRCSVFLMQNCCDNAKSVGIDGEYTMKIGFFTAMEKEAASFVENVKPQKIADFVVYEFALGEHDAVLCMPPSVGEIAAAAACQLLISRYNVDCVLNFGIVGGVTEQMSSEKAVYVGSVVHYDMDTSQIDKCPVGYYECFDGTIVYCDKALLDKALNILPLPVVRCASADKFVADPKQKSLLASRFDADICDMESAAALFVCKFNNVPFLSVKCISDTLFGGENEYWQNAKNMSEMLRGLSEKLCRSLDK